MRSFLHHKPMLSEYAGLDQLFQEARKVSLEPHSRFVIFSDLHMGHGGRGDDFKKNAPLFKFALEEYYEKQDYSLILNGDIEDIQKFSWQKIRIRWNKIFKVFTRFHEMGRLYKTEGNHDLAIQMKKDYPYPICRALVLETPEYPLFIFHGHQTSGFFNRFNTLVGFVLGNMAAPLGIKNYTVSQNATKKFRTENVVYNYSRTRKVISIMGHTHRPLFESKSKLDAMRYALDNMIMDLNNARPRKQKSLEKQILQQKKQIERWVEKAEYQGQRLYSSEILVPTLFNAGCVIGKRGMTCIEIENGTISLVHWFVENTERKYIHFNGSDPQQIDNSPYYRMVINSEELTTIMNRIKYLA